MVGVARALAADPDILLLDEPAAGLDDAESEELGRLIRQVAQDWGIGVLLIEHDVPLVAAVSDFVIALDFGKSIEMGTPTDVLASASVRRAYLGEEDAGQAPATAEYPGGRTAS
jgi:sulfate-transporting ATPase